MYDHILLALDGSGPSRFAGQIGVTPIAKYKYIGSRVAQRNYRDLIYYEPKYDNLGRITSANSGTSYAKFDYEYDPNTNNIIRQIYDHRTSPVDPCTDFSYDNLDRLTLAEYGIDDTNEAFTIDDLGNRKNVNVRDGNDITYTVDNLTNRYTSIADANLSYNAAGDLIKDKDSYEYEYDYENRIVKITKDGNDIAEFAYNALASRVEKKDLIDPNNTRRYYYNYKWQVLTEYNGSGVFKQWYAYGNYIDEVLAKGTAPWPVSAMFYIHDHLYSPAALTNYWGTVLERYEYDAYGSPTIWNADFTTERDNSNYGNSYLFTGRRVDILDSGSLKIQYNRNRYYDYYSGRWLTHDPLGYIDGMNLYDYVGGTPVRYVDAFGLLKQAVIEWPKLDGTALLAVRADECDDTLCFYVDKVLKWEQKPEPGTLRYYPFDYKWLKRQSPGTVELQTSCNQTYTRNYMPSKKYYDEHDFRVSLGLGEGFGLHFASAYAQGSYTLYVTSGDDKLFWGSKASVWDTAIRVYAHWYHNEEAGHGKGLLTNDESPFGKGSEKSKNKYYVNRNPSIERDRRRFWPPPPPLPRYGTQAELIHRPPFNKWFV